MALSNGTKVTITADDGFKDRTGTIADSDAATTVHQKCTETHYFVDIDPAEDAPDGERVMFHAGDFK